MIGFTQLERNVTEQSMSVEVCIALFNEVSIEAELSLYLQTEELTATSEDFLELNATISFNGSTCLQVDVFTDDVLEDTETFGITLESLDPRLMLILGSEETRIDIIDSNSKPF